MPSFDIVSKTDLNEVDNSINMVNRTIQTRFDFKGSNSSIERSDENITLLANDEMQIKQLIQLFVAHRHEVLLRKTKFELKQAAKRAHILEGLLIALDNLDAVIKLINNPELIIADEMTGNLDEKTADNVFEFFLEKISSNNQTLIYVTHNAKYAKKANKAFEISNNQIHKI